MLAPSTWEATTGGGFMSPWSLLPAKKKKLSWHKHEPLSSPPELVLSYEQRKLETFPGGIHTSLHPPWSTGPRTIPGPAKGSLQGDLILGLNMSATVPGKRADVFDGMLPLGRPGHVSLSLKILHTVVHTSTKKMSFILKGLQLKKPWKYQLLLWKVRPLAFCSIWRKRAKDLMEVEI